MKKILIALDYDPSAQKIAEEGYSLGKAMFAEVTLLHIVSDPVYYSSKVYDPIMGFGGYAAVDLLIPEDSENRLIKASEEYLNKTKKHLGDDNIKILVKEGDFADTILETAKKSHIDIIVMGSHSKRWLEQIVMGSVTERVLKNTSIPIYIIPIKKTII